MNEPYTHWIGVLPCDRRGIKGASTGAALAVVDRAGELVTLATMAPPHLSERAESLGVLELIVGGRFEEASGLPWRPFVLVEVQAPRGASSAPPTHAQAVALGASLATLAALEVPHRSINRRAWSEWPLRGVRSHGASGERWPLRLEAAGRRWSRFARAKRADQAAAEAALLAEYARLHFPSGAEVAA